jgi:arginine utilization protein RocB
MMSVPDFSFADRARDWALWLTRQPSVTGTSGEQALPLLLVDRVRTEAALQDCATWLIPADNDPLERQCAAVLARGTGRETVLLTGHFDTVSIADYGDLAGLATEPEALRTALLGRLAAPVTPAEILAKADLESDLFLPGRGLLDMKAGLAAGLAAVEAFLANPARRGNLLFVAVPDEEVTSVGARALAAALPSIEAERNIEVVAALNLDCIGDIGDGSVGRSIALGSVGKVLPTAYVVGLRSHASHPYQGLNAGALAGALAARLEWMPELSDAVAGQAGIPPTLLSIKDSKTHYDVTTPDAAFVTWNALTLRRSAEDVMRQFEASVSETVERFRRELAERRVAITGTPDVPAVAVVRAADLMAQAKAAGGQQELDELGARLAAQGLSLPDQNERLTAAAWRLSGRREAAVVLGFGSLPYPAVYLGDSERAQILMRAVETARIQAKQRHGLSLGITGYFPGISDMSFLGEARTDALEGIVANTPAWSSGVRWGGVVAGIPTINVGPWGRDYHTPLERVYTPYAFDELPGVLLAIAENSLAGHGA